MYQKKLKLQLPLLLLSLMVIAMMLINFVIFLVWYQNLLQQKVNSISSLVTGWSKSIDIESFFKDPSQQRKQTIFLKEALDEKGSTILFWKQGDPGSKSSSQQNMELLEQVMQTALSGRQAIQQHSTSPTFINLGTKRVQLSFPLFINKDLVAGVGVSFATDTIFSELLKKQKVIWLYILFNGLVLATIGFFRMRHIIFEPVEKLVSFAESYQVTEATALFPDQEENEFGTLAKSMNSMVQKLGEERDKLAKTVTSLQKANLHLQDAQDEVISAEKLAAAGRLSSSLAHEIGNPLAIIQGYLELLGDSSSSEEENQQYAKRSLAEIERIDRLLRQLLELTRTNGEQKIGPVDLVQLLQSVVEIMQLSFQKNNIQVKMENPDLPIQIQANPDELRQVLLNLLINAIDAFSESEQKTSERIITTTISTRLEKDRTMALIGVCDNGVGIRKENLDYIFEPFYTTKDIGQGTGLGLAVCYRIIQSFGGRIEVESEAGKSTTFTVLLPLIDDPHHKEVIE